MKKAYSISVGCDVVYLPRFKKVLSRTPSMRRQIFLPSEQKGVTLQSLAGIFAAKEAVIKALKFKAGDWHKIKVIKNKSGRPRIKLLKSNKKIVSQDISISHDGEYVFAVAVFFSF